VRGSQQTKALTHGTLCTICPVGLEGAKLYAAAHLSIQIITEWELLMVNIVHENELPIDGLGEVCRAEDKYQAWTCM